MERSVQLVHPDILARIALHLPLSSRLQLAATCRSMKSRVNFKHGTSQLEHLSSNVLHKIMWCLPHSGRLRIGAASWSLRKWAIQNGMLILHCWAVYLKDGRFIFYDEHDRLICALPFKDDDLSIRATVEKLALQTDFSRAHIDQSIRRLSAFQPLLRPDIVDLYGSETLNSRNDDPTAVRRFVECLGGTSKSFDTLRCFAKRGETLLLELDFLHRVQARKVYFSVGNIGPDGLDFAVEDSVQEDTRLSRGEYPCVEIDLIKRKTPTSSAPIVFNSFLRFIRAHFSSSPSVRFKYDVAFTCWDDDYSSAIRTLANEYGVQLETYSNENIERLRFTTPSDPTRRIVSVRWLNTASHGIFVGAGRNPWWSWV